MTGGLMGRQRIEKACSAATVSPESTDSNPILRLPASTVEVPLTVDKFKNVEAPARPTSSSERQPLTDKNKTDPGNLGKSLDPVYQSLLAAVSLYASDVFRSQDDAFHTKRTILLGEVL
ncbi:hypothetical protein T265_10426 [Opisthorchis viverrini]|uniref:Uncharacterized protein n=1 Tax=Opisthorchis viverrini TaxID=6198 RepID=A0A074ZDD0_OPIVI|nr:hypothetical protein T265_10426 [Opisthorchis viverrini]KER21200.1 hypothetical protein T265_10426 [Opisthorchis viverrini]